MIDLNEIFQDVKTEKIGQLLNETKESKRCLWYLICALDGMKDDQIIELAGFTIPQIQAARSKYLMKKYQGNSPLYQEVMTLKDEVNEIAKESREIRTSFENTVDQAVKEQIDKSNKLIDAKEEMIVMLKYQNVELQHQVEQLQKETERLEGQLKEKDKVNMVETKQQLQDTEKEDIVPKIELEKIQMEEVREGIGKRFRKYFSIVPNTKKFIETYLKNEKLSDDQKEYLLSCLESGMSLKEIEAFFSEDLSVDYMKRLNKLIQNRRDKV